MLAEPTVPAVPSRRLIRSIRVLVNRLGGVRRLSIELEVSERAIYRWIDRNCVPPEHALTVMREARRLGVPWVAPAFQAPDLELCWRGPVPGSLLRTDA